MFNGSHPWVLLNKVYQHATMKCSITVLSRANPLSLIYQSTSLPLEAIPSPSPFPPLTYQTKFIHPSTTTLTWAVFER